MRPTVCEPFKEIVALPTPAPVSVSPDMPANDAPDTSVEVPASGEPPTVIALPKSLKFSPPVDRIPLVSPPSEIVAPPVVLNAPTDSVPDVTPSVVLAASVTDPVPRALGLEAVIPPAMIVVPPV